jgi:protein-S-isoprenylcysteine O-methyltransferase Ste14
LFDHRNVLAGLPLVYTFFSVRGENESGLVVWPVACLLGLLGAALRAWARTHCFYGCSARKALATTGPYALVRNPLYIGNLLVIAAAAVASELAWFVPFAILWAFLVYCAVTRHEETRLDAKYGEEFRLYRSRVPAWWPRARLFHGMALGRDFGPGFLVQATYAAVALAPFLLKELNPFQLWPQP